MQAMINLVNICKIYNPGECEIKALNSVSLSINQNEFVAIVGNSGSGKSTLMNIIGCLDTPNSGEYFLDGTSVAHLTDKALSGIRNRQIGFIFQGFNLIPTMNAIENVELPLMYRGIPKDVRRSMALDALSKVGLSRRINHRPTQISGGQQQRVAIARALAAHPPIILADEPTGNLDSHSGREVIKILYDLWNSGKTVIIITHDEKIAAKAMRTIKVDDGKIISDI